MMEEILRKYEEMRQFCLRYGNLHPDDDSLCHVALGYCRRIDPLAHRLAALLDDQHLLIKQLIENHPPMMDELGLSPVRNEVTGSEIE
jgi:hypothetical protein